MHRYTMILCLAALALFAFCAPVHATDEPIFSAKRLSVSGQVGLEWERVTNVESDLLRIPSIKLVPVYRVWGPVDAQGQPHEGGSVALVFPQQLGLDADHKFRTGVFLSICLWAGSDLP